MRRTAHRSVALLEEQKNTVVFVLIEALTEVTKQCRVLEEGRLVGDVALLPWGDGG